MERIKQKPPLKTVSRDKGGTVAAPAMRRGAQLAVDKLKQQMKDAAEGGEAREKYSGEDALESALVAAGWTVNFASTVYQERHSEANQIAVSEIPEPEPSVQPQPPGGQSPQNGSQTQSPSVMPERRAEIKTKERYIQSQPTVAEREQVFPSPEQMQERGRALAKERFTAGRKQAAVKRDGQGAVRPPEGKLDFRDGAVVNRDTEAVTRARGLFHREKTMNVQRTTAERRRLPESRAPALSFGGKRSSTTQTKPMRSVKLSDRRLLSRRPLTVSPWSGDTAVMKGPELVLGGRREMVLPGTEIHQRAQRVQAVMRKSVAGLRKAVRATAQTVRRASEAAGTLIATLAGGGAAAVVVVLVMVLLGGLLVLVGGDNAAAVSPVSAEVLAYEPTLRRYAIQYGIPEYVELLKAVMMQESGGRGLDPMQAAEGSYNTRYPHVPNGITDPDYSIQCGVQELRDALNRAGVENPLDMDHIKLALQGYNFGPGYVTWALSHYGGYSLANAAEYSDAQAARLGWARYGDKQYVPHVLRYYAFGRMPTGLGNDAIVELALSQEGNDGTIYWSWFGHTSRVAWCSEFVSWCATQVGLVDAGLVPCTSTCRDGSAWFHERGRLMDASYIPVRGDIIYFDWEQDGRPDHVGIVVSVSEGRVHSIEGNSGDRVRQSSYSLSSGSIYGYGRVG